MTGSAAMTQRQPSGLSVKNFFVYNVKYGTVEGKEEEKIMYFHPRETNIQAKLKEVGLSEGIVKFAENFDPAECEAVHTEKTRKLFLQPEPDFWMIMTLNVPYGPKSSDPMESYDFLGSDVDTTIYRAVLKQAYSAARLRIGPFQAILDANEGDTTNLKEKLEAFFKRYILDLRLADSDILNVFDGVQFLPLDRTTFLHCQCFVNRIEATFPAVSYSLLLYNNSLLWSGLEPDDVRVVYRFISDLLLKHARANYLAKTQLSSGSSRRSNERFVTGPDGSIEFKTNVPSVYLGHIPQPAFHHLIVYRVYDLVVCLFIPLSTPLVTKLYQDLDKFLYDPMSDLISEIRAYRKSAIDPPEVPDTRYVYFNTMNLATKDTLREKRTSSGSDALVRALVRLHKHHIGLLEEGVLSNETFMRTAADHWVVGRMSNFRVFYIAVEKKKLTLQEVDDVAKKICESQLKGIFFHV